MVCNGTALLYWSKEHDEESCTLYDFLEVGNTHNSDIPCQSLTSTTPTCSLCTQHYTRPARDGHLFPCETYLFITMLSTCHMGNVIYYVANSTMSLNCYTKSPINPRVLADRLGTNPTNAAIDLFQGQREV
jgi:hypothetical protein